MATNYEQILICSEHPDEDTELFKNIIHIPACFIRLFCNLAFNDSFCSNQLPSNQTGLTTAATSLQLKPIQTQTEVAPDTPAKSQSRAAPLRNPANTSAIEAEKSKHSVETDASFVNIPVLTLGKQCLNYIFSPCFKIPWNLWS